MSDTASPRRGRIGLGKLAAIAIAAFAFTFSLVPLYRIACEKIFGIRLERGPADGETAAAAQAKTDRWVTVQFDGTVNSKLPWQFAPNRVQMKVRPGELYETTYRAQNTSDRVIVGSATPSVAPARASAFFVKTECFCFTAQTLAPGEARDMPVKFIVDPNLPADVQTLTLSYTFFKNDALTAQATAQAPTSPRAAP
ncbi:MAG TPA: cytochrome c oxidase assembly protein [Lysobacter sp.]|nr:cytochrome c oxidase assembly protein [Lysobacter sp.]